MVVREQELSAHFKRYHFRFELVIRPVRIEHTHVCVYETVFWPKLTTHLNNHIDFIVRGPVPNPTKYQVSLILNTLLVI